jgi:hypothetical protein
MNWQNAALGMAGVIGSCVAVAHGVLTQRLMVVPFERYLLNERERPELALVAGVFALRYESDGSHVIAP